MAIRREGKWETVELSKNHTSPGKPTDANEMKENPYHFQASPQICCCIVEGIGVWVSGLVVGMTECSLRRRDSNSTHKLHTNAPTNEIQISAHVNDVEFDWPVSV